MMLTGLIKCDQMGKDGPDILDIHRIKTVL